MAEKEVVETSEAQIAVHWQEEDLSIPPQFIAQANMTDETIYERFSLDNFPNCFKEYADLLDWYKYWDEILDTSDAPCYKWFKGGQDQRQLQLRGPPSGQNKNKTAIHFVPELEEEKVEHITYQELYVRVNELAALLRDFAGLKRGDRVTLHLPMTPELPITMLACARLGVIHSQVFGGFSGRACADRIVDSGSRVLITMDAYYRGGNPAGSQVKKPIRPATWPPKTARRSTRYWSGSAIPASTPARRPWWTAGILRQRRTEGLLRRNGSNPKR
jgi:acetyl-CoA synthetase